MKNILFILHYPPPIHGASMMGQYIRESKLVNSSFNCHYINLSTSNSVDEIGKTGLIKWFRYIKILTITLNRLLSFKPNTVYLTLTASGTGFYKDALVAIIAKLFSRNIVYHFHNKGVQKAQHNWFNNILYKIIFHNAQVILLSKYLYSDIEKYVSIKNVYYCANGIPKNIVNSESSVKKNTVQLLFFSNLIESKGVILLLEACKLLKKQKLNFNCLFIGGEGDITTKTFIDKVKELQIENVVEYKGKMYGQDKEDVYAQADIFVLPTYYSNECFPLVILEAMQWSLPVVTTDEGGIKDIIDVGRTGLLADKNNIVSLSEKLRLLITSPEMRLKMGKAGKEKFDKEFTIDLFETRLVKILNQI
ncbi:glycosyltransferase family 4 protein [Maribacter sp. MAR_2009_72]|uniref:glycosyltransferase family 4 protein n=1 Tax=Maribacter sp. MAR_2009_72 TaxID=1250050 RepID=UPI0011991E5A|nr:glycosyltransferase family 4 protein [Maribacter sp. MAR_2009_72]TVZ16947.1 glycosyltransferase involved in cell wall biosynthesis [Maribacter sp. MAR_2009_72]